MDNMSDILVRIADKSVTIAENEQKVFESGKKAERKHYWSVLQNNGEGANYRYAFCYSRYDDTTYNPQFDIRCTNAESSAQYMFYDSPITDTKVAIYAPTTNIAYCFQRSAVKIIREITVYESTTFNNAFQQCNNLEQLTMKGVIGQNGFNVQWSTKLSHDSIVSIINALSTTTSGLTVTLSKIAVNNAFETSEGAGDGSTSKEWLDLIATKSNWTISLI